ncbi:MAG: hypothetical protein M1814_000461 [Vezdaea aestivalis]|nr:MAG: hypothetical protein M1814_000461 [Vezdaea aestivalis]
MARVGHLHIAPSPIEPSPKDYSTLQLPSFSHIDRHSSNLYVTGPVSFGYNTRYPSAPEPVYYPTRSTQNTPSLLSDSDSTRGSSGYDQQPPFTTYRTSSVDSWREDTETFPIYHRRPHQHEQRPKTKYSRRLHQPSPQSVPQVGRSGIRKNKSAQEEHKRLQHKESEQKRRNDQKASTEVLKTLFSFGEHTTKQQVFDTSVEFVRAFHRLLPDVKQMLAATDPIEACNLIPVLEGLTGYFDGRLHAELPVQ